MRDYRAESYGDGIADVYDDWYHAVSDVDATVGFLDEVSRRATGGEPANVLELAAGTGRLAIPLAALGHHVTGLDVSEPMLDRLRAADTEQRVTSVGGDMVDDLPAGPFDVVFVAYNSLFMLTEPERQAACFSAVASVLAPAGVFVVEAFVPDDPPRRGHATDIRMLTADRVVLAVSITDPDTQQVTGQYVDLVHGQPVRLRPYFLRYSTPIELDSFATEAGLRLEQRFQDVYREPFGEESGTHISVYERQEREPFVQPPRPGL